MSRRSQVDRSTAPARADEAAAPTVVIGFDGTETSWNAFWWACGEAKRAGARLVAAFVSSTHPTRMVATASALSSLPCDLQAIETAATEEAQDLEAKLSTFAVEQHLELTFLHARGDPATELVRIAQAVHADLIAVGKSTSLVHHLAGSVGRRLLGDRDTPVVVVVP